MEEPAYPAQASIVYPDFAWHWVKKLGASTYSLTALPGGINNQVYSCEVGAKRFVIKGYAPIGLNDRMLAEVEFLRYAKYVASSYVPGLVAEDPERRCIVMEYVEGQPYEIGQSPSRKEIFHAGNFFHLLNVNKLCANQYVKHSAVEGYLSLSEHLENVYGRLAQLTTEQLSSDLRVEANLLLRRINREFDVVSDHTKNLLDKGQIQDSISPDARCISPSDFGFHNALQVADGVKFFDFEFAGWDDPAKVLVDFMLQPRIPVKPDLAAVFYQSIAPFGGKELKVRSAILGPILRLKWLCIILSVLRPDRLLQMKAVAHNSLNENFIKQRLNEAQAYINKEFSFGLY